MLSRYTNETHFTTRLLPFYHSPSPSQEKYSAKHLAAYKFHCAVIENSIIAIDVNNVNSKRLLSYWNNWQYSEAGRPTKKRLRYA